jgi:hypothetical protein
MIVEELGELLAQTFIALAFVAKHHGPFEQGLLQLLRQIAPKIGGRGAKDEKITLRVLIAAHVKDAPTCWIPPFVVEYS